MEKILSLKKIIFRKLNDSFNNIVQFILDTDFKFKAYKEIFQ